MSVMIVLVSSGREFLFASLMEDGYCSLCGSGQGTEDIAAQKCAACGALFSGSTESTETDKN